MASLRTEKASRTGGASQLARAMAYATGSAPMVSPPTRSASQRARRIARRPSSPTSNSPLADMVVVRASM